MGKYPAYFRWVVKILPAQRRAYLQRFSGQLDQRLQQIRSFLRREIDEVPGFPAAQEDIEVIDVPDSPPLPVQDAQNVQPEDPIVISDDEEPYADIDDLLKNSEEEDTVEESVLTAPPFSFSELETEGDSVLEDLELSSAAVPMEVAEDALEDAVDNANDISNDDSEDALDDAEDNAAEDSMDNSKDAPEEAEDNAAEDSNEHDEDPNAIEVDQEISENVEALDEVPAIVEAAQEIPEDSEALEEGPEIEDPFLP